MAKKVHFVLPVLAAVVIVVAIVVGMRTKLGASSAGGNIVATVTDNVVSFSGKKLNKTVQYVDYEVDGIAMQLLAVKDSDGNTHVTLNACQNCNGSPRAFFVQTGNQVTCQNCGIPHAISQLGTQKLGCNPIPIRFTEQDGVISVARADLDRAAPLFTNWKKGL